MYYTTSVQSVLIYSTRPRGQYLCTCPIVFNPCSSTPLDLEDEMYIVSKPSSVTPLDL